MPLQNPILGAVDRLNIACKDETRALDAASGSVSYTGYGFKPKAIIVIGSMNGTLMATWGHAGQAPGGVADFERDLGQRGTEAGKMNNAGSILSFIESNGVLSQEATLTSFDADGFTLQWTRLGVTAAGTGWFNVLAFY